MSANLLSLPFTWTELDGAYVAVTAYGQVIATKHETETSRRFKFGTRQYKIRIELQNGEVLTPVHVFDSIESAEGYAYLELLHYESAQINLGDKSALLETLRFCSELLSSGGHDEHFEHLLKITHLVHKHYRETS
jgi:hypothetical protein